MANMASSTDRVAIAQRWREEAAALYQAEDAYLEELVRASDLTMIKAREHVALEAQSPDVPVGRPVAPFELMVPDFVRRQDAARAEQRTVVERAWLELDRALPWDQRWKRAVEVEEWILANPTEPPIMRWEGLERMDSIPGVGRRPGWLSFALLYAEGMKDRIETGGGSGPWLIDATKVLGLLRREGLAVDAVLLNVVIKERQAAGQGPTASEPEDAGPDAALPEPRSLIPLKVLGDRLRELGWEGIDGRPITDRAIRARLGRVKKEGEETREPWVQLAAAKDPVTGQFDKRQVDRILPRRAQA